MTIAVIQFPGASSDLDVVAVLEKRFSISSRLVWHKDSSLESVSGIILPGGSPFGGALRPGAIAKTSPIMQAVKKFANAGGAVLGISNGFQILCEAGLLPGAFLMNTSLKFQCQARRVRVNHSGAGWTREILGELLELPIAHDYGNYQVSKEELADLQKHQQILLQYANAEGKILEGKQSPEGAVSGIAGVSNRQHNVWGIMPYPERAVASFHASQDGLKVFSAFLKMAEKGR